MRYLKYRGEGDPIDAGAMENGIQCLKFQFTELSIRWFKEGPESIFAIHDLKIAGTFDET
jgi:hypothetical protein